MSRTVTALFGSRGEAEAARVCLAAQINVESARLLARDTAAALDGMAIEPKQVKRYRDALMRGDHLLVARVGRGENPAHILGALKKAAAAQPPAEEPQLSYEVGKLGGGTTTQNIPAPSALVGAKDTDPDETSVGVDCAPAAADVAAPVSAAAEPASADRQFRAAEALASKTSAPESAADESELRIGEQRVARGALHRSTTDSLPQMRLETESRPPARRLTDDEVKAGGLLKDRVIEFIEMREEPVIAKEVVVREEVIVRKTIDERTEKISDTVRRTDAKVEELP